MSLLETEKLLIIAPHADDETLGCGGTIAKLSNLGKEVFVLIATNANVGAPELFSQELINKVREEALSAHSLLGVKETLFAEFPAPCLDTFPIYKIANHISEILTRYNIDSMLIPHRGDIHLDHRRLFEASLIAARPIGTQKVKRIYAYETLSETEWAAPFPDDNFLPQIFVNIKDQLPKKLEAFSCFKSQIKDFPHPRSIKNIESLARLRGSTVSCEAAEAYSLIREII